MENISEKKKNGKRQRRKKKQQNMNVFTRESFDFVQWPLSSVIGKRVVQAANKKLTRTSTTDSC